jgi:hypothetical protein
LKAAGEPMLATTAVAVISPTPGISAALRHEGVSRSCCDSRRSMTPISASNLVDSAHLLVEAFDEHGR